MYTDETQRALLKNALSFYVADTGFGSINIASSSNPLLFLFGILASIGISAIWSMKLIIFYPIVFGVVISSYLLIRKLTQSSLGAFFGALVYAYSTYFLITLTGALYLSLAYALSPLLLLAFIRVLETPSLYRKTQLSLIAAAIGYIEFRVLYINMLILTLYFFYSLFFEKKTMKEMVISAYSFVPSVVMLVLLNLFWIIPLSLAGKISENVLFDRDLFGDSYFDTLNALAVFHPWWTGEMPAIFHKQTASVYFFLLPVVVLFTLLFYRRKKILPFLVIFALGVFLTKQSAEPFEALYLWLYKTIPGFNAFREASKFYLMSALSSSVLVGYFFSRLTKASHQWLRLQYFFIAAFSIFLSMQVFPVARGSLETMFIPREFPEEYEVVNEFLSKDSEYYRILWFPHTNRFGISSNLHPSVSFLLNMETAFKDFVDPSQSKFVASLSSPFSDEKFPIFLEQASFRYIVVPSNLEWDDVKSPWKDPENYVEFLDKTPYLTRIENDYLSQRGISVYENRNYRPHFYLSSVKPSYHVSSEVGQVNFQMIRPTEYRVSLKNLHEPVFLNFSENYHPDWRIRLGEFHWRGALFSGKDSLSDEFHMKNDFGMNSFYLDPMALKEQFPPERYHENSDGSIDLDMTLYFHSQGYYFIGLLVSVGAMFVSILILVYGIFSGINGFIKGKNYEK